MKQIKYITVLSICAFITFSSCKKENENTPEINSQDQTTQKLIEFKNKLNTKNDGFLSIENATWHLEGLLNYENANNNHDMNNIIHQYDTLTYDFSGEYISFIELGVVYLDLNKKLNQYIKLYPSSKFDLIDLTINISNNKTTVALISSIGTTSAKLIYQPFGGSDYWTWGNNTGKCDGTFVGTDAADQLKHRFNNPVGSFVPGYYTDIVSVFEYYNSHPISYPYRIFMTTGPGSSPGTPGPCISPENLNYFLSQFDYIKDINCPSGKKFKNVNIFETISTSYDVWAVAHYYQLFYGVFTSGYPSY